MDEQDEIAPAVESILSAARERDRPTGRASVEARSLPGALAAAEGDGRTPVIAEVKPTSPTADGEVDADPVALAEAMVEGGAAALSVLTEPEHFGGSPETLTAVREAVDVPVLRKDFLLEETQLDAVAADVVLVIARFVDDLDGLVAAARDRGFQVLVEVHSPAEFEAAVEAGADVIGVNNRDLARLEVDLETFESVIEDVEVPDGVTVLAESGITEPDDARQMRAAGADGLLIGSAIMDHGRDSGPADVRANTERFTAAENQDEPTTVNGDRTTANRERTAANREGTTANREGTTANDDTTGTHDT